MTDTIIDSTSETQNREKTIENDLFDDVWGTDTDHTPKGLLSTMTNLSGGTNRGICDWDDIINMYEPTRPVEKPVKAPIKPIVVIPTKRQQKKVCPKKDVKPVINKSKVYDEYDEEYDDTYDDYY
jgi:hypothetical protein